MRFQERAVADVRLLQRSLALSFLLKLISTADSYFISKELELIRRIGAANHASILTASNVIASPT